MSRGMIQTSRGETLNIDQLIQQANAVPGSKVAKSTRENSAYKPKKNNRPRIRGFIPARGEAVAPVTEAKEAEPIVVEEETKTPNAKRQLKSDAEHTSVKVRKTRRAQVVKEETEKAGVEMQDEVLGDLLSEMNASSGKAKQAERLAKGEDTSFDEEVTTKKK